MNLSISEDVQTILLHVADQLGLDKGLTAEERMEIAIDALAMSYDSQTAQEATVESTPASANELNNAVRQVLDADISIPLTHDKPQGELNL